MIYISKSDESPSPSGEGLGARSNLTKRKIEVKMFAAGAKKYLVRYFTQV